jgi:hypothetical protein
MSADVAVSRWAVEQFGDQAAEVMKRVVTALTKAHRAAWRVQVTAVEQGASNRRPYGSMWVELYHFFTEEFQDLEGVHKFRPPGASYSLVVLNSRVLIPFRYSTNLRDPIGSAKIKSEVPKKVSRNFGVKPPPTLFDDIDEPVDGPEAAEAAAAAGLTVIYIAFAANADTDRLLAAGWGTTVSLDKDGRLNWTPEKLRIDIADESAADSSTPGGLAAGPSSTTSSFDEGEQPALDVSPRHQPVPVSSPEPEPTTPTAENGND